VGHDRCEMERGYACGFSLSTRRSPNCRASKGEIDFPIEIEFQIEIQSVILRFGDRHHRMLPEDLGIAWSRSLLEVDTINVRFLDLPTV
jgi:hypothetical protein